MPVRWKDLPIPEYRRRSLEVAFQHLPNFLNGSTAVDDEVVDFTQNGGWRKIDKLFPLLRIHGIPFRQDWMASLRQFTAKVKVSDLPFVWRQQLTLSPRLLRSESLSLQWL